MSTSAVKKGHQIYSAKYENGNVFVNHGFFSSHNSMPLVNQVAKMPPPNTHTHKLHSIARGSRLQTMYVPLKNILPFYGKRVVLKVL